MGLTNDQLARLTNQPPTHIKSRVEKTVIDTLFKIQETWPEKPSLTLPTITYALKGGVAGRAIAGAEIQINLDYLLDDRYTEDVLADTIPHEVAHIACFQWWPEGRVHHGPQWQLVMVRLGLNPKRTHEYEVRPARRSNPTRYLFSCHCPGRIHKLSSNRFTRYQRGSRYLCAVCRAPLTYTGGVE